MSFPQAWNEGTGEGQGWPRSWVLDLGLLRPAGAPPLVCIPGCSLASALPICAWTTASCRSPTWTQSSAPEAPPHLLQIPGHPGSCSVLSLEPLPKKACLSKSHPKAASLTELLLGAWLQHPQSQGSGGLPIEATLGQLRPSEGPGQLGHRGPTQIRTHTNTHTYQHRHM